MNNKAVVPNFELLKDAYAIIGGIPRSLIDLDLVVTSRGKSLSCGTIACAAGWLGMHPQFQALGLGIDPVFGDGLSLNGKTFNHTYAPQMAEIFNLPEEVADEMFGHRGFRESVTLSDKQVWLKRVREYLRKNGQLSHQLAQKAKA